MAKTDFALQIQVPPADWGIESKFEISAVDCPGSNDDSWVDQHLTEMYPELESLGEISDLMEGSMEYWGDLSMEELKTELVAMGFQVV